MSSFVLYNLLGLACLLAVAVVGVRLAPKEW